MKRFIQFLKALVSPSVSEHTELEMDDDTKPVTPPLKEGNKKKGGRNTTPPPPPKDRILREGQEPVPPQIPPRRKK